MSFSFVPPDGYRNTTDFPTKPASETAFRDSMQDLLDQIRDYMNTNLANKVQEAWIAPTLLNSWVNYNADGYETVGYYKDNIGIVHIKGTIKSGTVGSYAFNLPVGYRPAATLGIAALCNTGTTDILGRIHVDTAGIFIASGSNVQFFLDIAFRAEA